MKNKKIFVYAISKNEEKFVERWVSSMKEADEIYVLDTGSTDNTVSKLKELGVNVTSKIFEPWRFDVARNMSLDLVPNNTDICVCTDLDEIFEPGWRNKLESIWNDDTTRLAYNYNWSLDKNNTPIVNFYIEKIHSRNDYKWTHPVHEVLTYIGNANEKRVKKTPSLSEVQTFLSALHELGVSHASVDFVLHLNYSNYQNKLYVERMENLAYQKNKNYKCEIRRKVSKQGIEMIKNFEMSKEVLKEWDLGAFDENGELVGIYPHYVFKNEQTEDGQKIYIPNINDETDEIITTENGEGIIENLEESSEVVNINKADIEDLLKLPGVGESLAQRIINYREENGKIKSSGTSNSFAISFT